MAIINSVIAGGRGSGYYIDKEIDANGKLVIKNPLDLSGVRDLGDNVLKGIREKSTYTGELFVNATELTTVSGAGAMLQIGTTSHITSMTLPNLVSITGSLSGHVNFANEAPWYGSALRTLNLPALTTVSGESALDNFCWGATALTSIDLHNLTTISGTSGCLNMFYGCTSLPSVDLSSLTTISGAGGCQAMFYGCTGLTSADLSSLTTISGYYSCQKMFGDCGLTSVYLKSLKRIENYSERTLSMSQMFGNCPVVDLRNLQYAGNYTIDSFCYLNNTLSSINLNSLEHIGTEAARTLFYLTTPSSSLSNIYFPMLTSFGSNPFYTNAFTGRTNITIHFRKDMQSTVEALPNYATLWGAGAGSSAVFDLIGTLTGADGNAYTRSEINSVYASETAGAAKTATGWKYNNTVYYTSGGTEPSVGDTIYSDAACTTAVTTISTIA